MLLRSNTLNQMYRKLIPYWESGTGAVLLRSNTPSNIQIDKKLILYWEAGTGAVLLSGSTPSNIQIDGAMLHRSNTLNVICRYIKSSSPSLKLELELFSFAALR